MIAGALTLIALLLTGSPVGTETDEPGDSHALSGLELVDLDGRRWTTDDLLERIVLLDFWATWCAPCLAEMPRLRQLALDHPDDLVLLGVAIESGSRRELVRWLRTHDVSWPQIVPRNGFDSELARRFDVEALPRTVLIDRRGRIVAGDLRGEPLSTAVAAMVGPDDD